MSEPGNVTAENYITGIEDQISRLFKRSLDSAPAIVPAALGIASQLGGAARGIFSNLVNARTANGDGYLGSPSEESGSRIETSQQENDSGRFGSFFSRLSSISDNVSSTVSSALSALAGTTPESVPTGQVLSREEESYLLDNNKGDNVTNSNDNPLMTLIIDMDVQEEIRQRDAARKEEEDRIIEAAAKVHADDLHRQAQDAQDVVTAQRLRDQAAAIRRQLTQIQEFRNRAAAIRTSNAPEAGNLKAQARNLIHSLPRGQ